MSSPQTLEFIAVPCIYTKNVSKNSKRTGFGICLDCTNLTTWSSIHAHVSFVTLKKKANMCTNGECCELQETSRKAALALPPALKWDVETSQAL